MSDQPKNVPPNQLSIELPEDIADGIYSNLAIIAHSHSEFVIDFVAMMPNTPKAKVKSRIILTPEHAKRLSVALIENIKKYEATHGRIADPAAPNFPPVSFSPKAEA
ncbi:MAG: DUF3467 domain-containing protein [Bacteroidetes bacterium]|nr:MAG: DUF3467 domain-containing protein [Bacteroidota bacterium]